jgi:hypothetical protein
MLGNSLSARIAGGLFMKYRPDNPSWISYILYHIIYIHIMLYNTILGIN